MKFDLIGLTISSGQYLNEQLREVRTISAEAHLLLSPKDYNELANEITSRGSFPLRNLQFNLGVSGLRIQPLVTDIYPNEKKRTVVVKFKDGTIIKSTCSKDDTFDVTSGAAICIASYLCGGKQEFHTLVERRLKKLKRKTK